VLQAGAGAAPQSTILTRLPVKDPLVVILNLIQDLEKATPV
jgi:hypothetical protein